MSNEFEFDVPALCPVQARPTWMPERSWQAIDGTAHYGTQQISRSITSFGRIAIEVAQNLQPGGIFPDQIRIQCFRSFKEASFYTPTDFRGFMPHILGRPMKYKPALASIYPPS